MENSYTIIDADITYSILKDGVSVDDIRKIISDRVEKGIGQSTSQESQNFIWWPTRVKDLYQIIDSETYMCTSVHARHIKRALDLITENADLQQTHMLLILDATIEGMARKLTY
ncbi:unnamed protein product [Blepharisma stoltei]|uniref:Uncharacterized protein n=1 Tax=Blepharisma stoltei TaxID=1481888 RepID=A0AAU9JMG7_9CILI|nr:unnamed protein product [Blepharisma stoltei]